MNGGQTDTTTSTATPDGGRDLSAWSTWLIGVATFLAILSVFSTWVRAQALDTDTWVEVSDDLLDEPEIQNALSAYLVDQLYAQLDLQAELEESLPDDLVGLAGPITGALRGPATEGARRLVGSDAFAEVWSTVNRNAHETLVRVLRDETRPGISTADGTVRLELDELVRLVGDRLGVSGGLLDRLPEDAGSITVFESEQLETAQTAIRVLDFLSWFLFVLVVVLYAAAVYVAAGHRLRALRNVGLALLGAGVFVIILRALAVRGIVSTVVDDPATRPIAFLTSNVVTRLIVQMAWSGIIYGVLIAGFAALLGDRAWAGSTRRGLAPALNAAPAAVAGGTATLILLLVWWSPGRAFDRWVTGLTLIALVIAAVVALRRATRRDHPDASLADVTSSLTGRWRRSASAPAGLDSRLAALDELRDTGALTAEEYDRARERARSGAATEHPV